VQHAAPSRSPLQGLCAPPCSRAASCRATRSLLLGLLLATQPRLCGGDLEEVCNRWNGNECARALSQRAIDKLCSQPDRQQWALLAGGGRDGARFPSKACAAPVASTTTSQPASRPSRHAVRPQHLGARGPPCCGCTGVDRPTSGGSTAGAAGLAAPGRAHTLARNPLTPPRMRGAGTAEGAPYA